MSLAADSDSSTTSGSTRKSSICSSTTSGSTRKRCSSTTSGNTRKSSICSTCDLSDTDSGTDEEN